MRLKTLHGDTLIEVMLSISIFALVAMLTINMMNDGINTAQRTLEAAMARNEIDAQAEALRYIHNSYVAERQLTDKDSQFKGIWSSLTNAAVPAKKIEDNESDYADGGKSSFDINNMDSCDRAYSGDDAHLSLFESLILNTRLVLPGKSDYKYLNKPYKELLKSDIIVQYKDEGNRERFRTPTLYPRIIYKKFNNDSETMENANLNEDTTIDNAYNLISAAEGVWIDVVGNNDITPARSDYYDFYIRTCWQSAGTSTPSTITTVVRLYNPEVME